MASWDELRTWALPGMRIKRWVLAVVGGIALMNGGVALAMYDALRPTVQPAVPGGPALPLLLLGLGVWAAAYGMHRVVALIIEVLQPSTPLVDAMYAHRSRSRGPKIVAIGGGTGLATLLRGLKEYSDNLTAIVTVADDGGSSGRLRQELGVLPPGDIRNCLSALAREERLLTDLFRFRFPGSTGLGGHAFGNLFLAALIGVTRDPQEAIRAACRVLAVRGMVVPATAEPMTLYARFEDGTVVEGESNITAWRRVNDGQGASAGERPTPCAITDIWCAPAQARPLDEAVRAIEEADAVVIGPGSLYTSLVPNLLVPGLREALHRTRAPIIYVCNVMTQPGETDGFSAADHVRTLMRYGGAGIVQHVLVNDALPHRLRQAYEAQGQYPVELDWDALVALGVTPVRGAFLDEADAVRHHPGLLAAAIMTWWEALLPEGRRAERGQPALAGEGPP